MILYKQFKDGINFIKNFKRSGLEAKKKIKKILLLRKIN